MNDQVLTDSILFADIMDLNVIDAADPLVDLGLNDVEAFLRDWRVAGALMESVQQVRYKPLPIEGARWVANASFGNYEWRKGSNDSLPRAIIEACVSALTTGVHGNDIS